LRAHHRMDKKSEGAGVKPGALDCISHRESADSRGLSDHGKHCVQVFEAAHEKIVFAIPAAYAMFVYRLLTTGGLVVSVPSVS
jgi:hypothetical protein